MAAKLQCEICGGKLIGKPGGIFECDSCGMEYSTEWAKEKIQEITGTIKVEGTVDVQGIVKVDSSPMKESLLHRGMMALEEGEWEEAVAFFDEVLDYDSKCAEAYLGLAMAEECCHNEKDFFEAFIRPDTSFAKNKNVQYVNKYGNQNLRLKIETANKKHEANAQAALIKNKQDSLALLSYREERKLAREMIYSKSDGIVGICSDGRVFACPPTYGSDEYKSLFAITDWTDIVAILIGEKHVLGLRGNGTVLARGDNTFGQCDVSGWKGIKSISIGLDYSIGLRFDGTVVAAGHNIDSCCEVSDWNSIIQVVCLSYYSTIRIYSETIGLKSDGTLVITGTGLYNRSHSEEVKKLKNIISIKLKGNLLRGDELRQDGSIIKHLCGDPFVKTLPDNIVESTGKYSLQTDMTITGYSSSDDSSVLASWKNIIDISGGSEFFIGLHQNGTVSSYVHSVNERTFGPKAAQLKTWSNIVAIYSIGLDCYGLQEDGRLVTTCEERKEELTKWKLFNNYKTIDLERKEVKEKKERERIEAQEKRERERKEWIEHEEARKKNQIEKLNKEREQLETEFKELTGLFSRKRRREIQQRLSEIESKLDGLK